MATDDRSEQSLGDLAKLLSEQTGTLVRQELALARAELQEKGKRAGIGGGLLGAGALVALYGAAALVAAVILLVATALDAWIGVLIVGAVLLGIAGVLALAGRKQVQAATPPAPERAVETVKDDAEVFKQKARRS